MSNKKKLKFDEIGIWSEIKLEIIKKYASAYSTILSKKSLHHVYIDGFCGAGEHLSKDGKRIISGSPKNALEVGPPFEQYYFIDMNPAKINYLRKQTDDRDNVFYFNGDCNIILLREVFPNIRYDNYYRALCLLDPYGLDLDWDVIQTAGQSRVIEIFLNFPVADMNRNVFWRNPEKVTEKNLKRMNKFWGDESWKDIAYREEDTLFGTVKVKEDNFQVADGFRKRLKKVAGFNYVPDPIPMKNSQGAIVYYLFFASPKEVANKIVNDIFNKYK